MLGCQQREAPTRSATGRPAIFDEPGTWQPQPVVGAPRAELPDGLSLRDFTMYTRTPLTLETKRERMGIAAITPTPLLFVRNNLPMPERGIVDDPEAWTLSVEGVAKPRKFTLRELKALGVQTIAAVLQCSGNGRRFFEHGASGSPWGVGAAGCVLWTGVPVAAVLDAVGGAVETAKFLTATGGDPIPVLPKGFAADEIRVERSIPLSKRDCLLAWEMNGIPLPLTHGGPLRLVVPGYYGVNSVKYVRTLACTQNESPARIQRKGYRVRPIGEGSDATQPSMWRMNVKSWINGAADVLAGKGLVHGVAFSGERWIRKIELSIDGGANWRNATLLEPDLGKYAWRAFALEVDLPRGKHVLASRATDAAGEVQPEHRVENERGYGNNAWRDLALHVEAHETLPARVEEPVAAARSGRAPLSAAAQRGREVFIHEAAPPCGACHSLADAQAAMKLGPNLDALSLPQERIEAAITNGAGAMPGYAGKLDAEQIRALATYLREAGRGP